MVPALKENTTRFEGLPENMWINSVTFSRYGSRIALTVRSPGGPSDPPRTASELWIVDMETLVARPALEKGPCQLNSIFQESRTETDTQIIDFVGFVGLMKKQLWRVVCQSVYIQNPSLH